MKRTSMQKLTRLAVLVAVTLLMAFTPLGYFKTAGVELSFLMIPVTVGAIVLGPVSGMILGAVFGITSFVQCLNGTSFFGATLLGISPVATLLTCLPTRMLAGLLPGLLFHKLGKGKRSLAACAGAAVLGPVLNTVLFTGCVVLFFFQTAYIQSMANGLGVLAFCAAFVGVQGLIEAIVCFLLSVPISKALLHLTGTRQKPESI